jgi:hypothetical protein
MQHSMHVYGDVANDDPEAACHFPTQRVCMWRDQDTIARSQLTRSCRAGNAGRQHQDPSMLGVSALFLRRALSVSDHGARLMHNLLAIRSGDSPEPRHRPSDRFRNATIRCRAPPLVSESRSALGAVTANCERTRPSISHIIPLDPGS